jgi:hypothetical protein
MNTDSQGPPLALSNNIGSSRSRHLRGGSYWALACKRGNILPLSELLKEIGGDVSEERKREMKALFDGQAALKEHSGIAE